MTDFESDVWVFKEAISKPIDYNNGLITRATMNLTMTTGSDYNLNLYLSNNNGTNWEGTGNGTSHTFSSTGSSLRWKIDGAGEIQITQVNINYEH